VEAFQLAVQLIHQSRDPALYQQVLSTYEHVSAHPDLPVKLPNPMQIAQLDTKWSDEMMAKNAAEKVKLEVELKTYTNNMIKESIRVRVRSSSVSGWVSEILLTL
jgi:COP9 signalosome complex subunit 1